MAKPLPVPNADTAPFWEGCARGELLYQYCLACDRPQFYPRRFCARCHGDRIEWRRSERRGTIHSATRIFRAPSEAFKEMAPYVLALVDLDEGFRLMVNILGENSAEPAIGDRVEIIFVPSGGISLPQGRLIP